MTFTLKQGLMLSIGVSFPLLGYAVAVTEVAAMAFNADHSRVYLGQLSATQIQYCPISNHQLATCRVTGPTVFIMPSRMALSPQGNALYVVDQTYHTLSKCDINPANDQLLECEALDVGLDEPNGVAIDPQNRYGYVSYGSGTVGISICTMTATGTMQNCQAAKTRVTQPSAITINNAGTQLYVLSAQSNTIWSCAINQSNGKLGNCGATPIEATSRYPSPGVLAHNIYASKATNLNHEHFVTSCTMNEAGHIAYVNQYADGSAFRCLIDQNTADFRACFEGGSALGYAEPLNIILNARNTQAYLFSAGLVKWRCALDVAGVLTRCTHVTQVVPFPWDDMTP